MLLVLYYVPHVITVVSRVNAQVTFAQSNGKPPLLLSVMRGHLMYTVHSDIAQAGVCVYLNVESIFEIPGFHTFMQVLRS